MDLAPALTRVLDRRCNTSAPRNKGKEILVEEAPSDARAAARQGPQHDGSSSDNDPDLQAALAASMTDARGAVPEYHGDPGASGSRPRHIQSPQEEHQNVIQRPQEAQNQVLENQIENREVENREVENREVENREVEDVAPPLQGDVVPPAHPPEKTKAYIDFLKDRIDTYWWKQSDMPPFDAEAHQKPPEVRDPAAAWQSIKDYFDSHTSAGRQYPLDFRKYMAWCRLNKLHVSLKKRDQVAQFYQIYAQTPGISKNACLQMNRSLEYFRKHEHYLYGDMPEPIKDNDAMSRELQSKRAREPAEVRARFLPMGDNIRQLTIADVVQMCESAHESIAKLYREGGSAKRQVPVAVHELICVAAILTFSINSIQRGDDVRDIEFPALYLGQLDSAGPSKCRVMYAVRDHGKTNSGTQSIGAIISRYPVLCAPSNVMAFLFYRWHVRGEKAPKMDSRPSWFHLKLFSAYNDPAKEIRYGNHYKVVRNLFRENDLFLKYFTHVGRQSGYSIALDAGVSREEVKEQAHHNTDRSSRHYANRVNVQSALATAGWDPNAPRSTFHIPWHEVEPPHELVKKVFPWAESLLDAVREQNRQCQQNGTATTDNMKFQKDAERFLELLIAGRRWLVVWVAMMQKDETYAGHPVVHHQLFTDNEDFDAYKLEVQKLYEDANKPMDPHRAGALQAIAPEILSCMASQSQTIVGLQQQIGVLNREVRGQSSMLASTSAQMRHISGLIGGMNNSLLQVQGMYAQGMYGHALHAIPAFPWRPQIHCFPFGFGFPPSLPPPMTPSLPPTVAPPLSPSSDTPVLALPAPPPPTTHVQSHVIPTRKHDRHGQRRIVQAIPSDQTPVAAPAPAPAPAPNPNPNPDPTPLANVQYAMPHLREHLTLEEIYREYTEGLNDQPSVRDMLRHKDEERRIAWWREHNKRLSKRRRLYFFFFEELRKGTQEEATESITKLQDEHNHSMKKIMEHVDSKYGDTPRNWQLHLPD